jgi:hypothetical protein
VLVKALDRAWSWQKMLDSGVYCSVTEIAEAEKISKSYVSRRRTSSRRHSAGASRRG